MKPPPLPPPKRTPLRNDSRSNDQQTIVAWVLGGMAAAILLLLMVIALIVRREEIGGQQLGNQDSMVESIGELNAQSSNSSTSEDGSRQSDIATSEVSPSPSSPTIPSSDERSEAPSEPPSESAPQSEQSEVVVPRAIQIFDGSGAPALPIGASSSGGTNPFLGSRDAKQVVFVIDKSGSMSGGALERVKAALIEAIEALSDQQKFQVIFFESTAVFHPSLQGLVTADRANKSSYVNWISQMQANGGTEPVEAVNAGLSVHPERMVILSDGEFNPLYVEQITKFNRKSNTEKVTRIDCVGLAEQVESLKQIAQQNGPGVYYQAK